MWGLGSDANEPEWRVVNTPFTNDLFEVVSTSRGPFAVGDGGIIAGNRGRGWEIITNDGPNVSQNQLRTLDVTDDGKRLWFAGSSGAIGCYDVETNRKYDYSYPNEMTSTWESIAVSGSIGSEKLLVANGSGEILPCSVDGFTINWGVPAKPGSGSTLAGLAASPDGYGYGIDTSGNAYMTTKNDGWKDIGVIESQVKFYDIWAERNGRVYIAAGGGLLYRYDNSYRDWTPIGVADKGALHAFDMYKNQMVALGDGGLMYQRTDGGKRWEQIHTPTGSTLYDLALGKPDIAIGKGGLVLKRPRGKTRAAGKSPDDDQYSGRGEVYDPDPNAPGESGATQSNQSSTTQQSQTTRQPQQPRSEPVQPSAKPPQPNASGPTQQNQSQNRPQSRPVQSRQQSRESAPTQSKPQTQTEAGGTQSQTASSQPEENQSQAQNQTQSQPQNSPAETTDKQNN
jgi:photosystem II stability/assembly factor-like uncharacterized protein